MGQRGSNKPDVERYLKGRKRELDRRANVQAKRERLKQAVQTEDAESSSQSQTGTVLTRAKSGLLVQADRGESHHWCRSPQKGRGGMPVPGDRVRFLPQSETTDGWIEGILERRNLLRRWSFGRIKEIAANMDCIFILATPEQPKVSPRLVDRMLVGASVAGIGATVVVNKLDLIGRERAEQWSLGWREAGYDIILLSATDGEGMGELHGRLRGSISLLAGASGVGKSTVLNHLIEDLDLDTATISEATDRGVHTTSFTRLFPVPGGGVVADSPGIREFFPVLEDPADLVHHFPELDRLTGDCEFPDCRHTGDSRGCAVQRAVEEGMVNSDRHASYLLMLDSLREGPQRGRGRQFAPDPF